MNNRVLELEVTGYENEIVGYRDGILPYLVKQLQDYVEMLPTDNDCDFEHIDNVRRASEIICKIYENVQNDELISVYNILYFDMNYKKVKLLG